MDLFERLGTTRKDALLALAFAVVGLVQVALLPIAARGLGELVVLGSALPLAWRRTRPIEAALVSTAFWLIPVEGYPVLGFVAVVLQFYAVGSLGRPGPAVAATTGVAAVLTAVGTLLGPEPPVAGIGAVLAVVAPVLAGRLVHHQRLQTDELAALTEDLRRERLRAEEAAIGAERARIAQELHDVVGHEVTLIAIQAEAAAAALRLQPERAAEPVETIRSTAHRVLSEMRNVVDMLSPAEDGTPSGEDLHGLVSRSRAAGLDVRLSESGTPAPPHAPETLAVYRIARECVTNAARHAPGRPLELAVDWGPAEVVLTAMNPAPGTGELRQGRGLTGVRHRAELLGGTFRASCQDGQFVVRVALPSGVREAR